MRPGPPAPVCSAACPGGGEGKAVDLEGFRRVLAQARWYSLASRLAPSCYGLAALPRGDLQVADRVDLPVQASAISTLRS